MYLGYHQYQLYFDFLGVAILMAAVACLALLAFLAHKRSFFAAGAMACVLLALCAVQFYRGAMVPESAWVVMLGAIEKTTGSERSRLVTDLRSHWQARTMRAFDWYRLSKKWNVCHSMWHQVDCVSPIASEQGVGIARDILNDIATSDLAYTTTK
jgi:hypothetical protein